jgi:hypothetical protein
MAKLILKFENSVLKEMTTPRYRTTTPESSTRKGG